MIFQIQYWLEISKHSESQLHCLMSLINIQKNLFTKSTVPYLYRFFCKNYATVIKKNKSNYYIIHRKKRVPGKHHWGTRNKW